MVLSLMSVFLFPAEIFLVVIKPKNFAVFSEAIRQQAPHPEVEILP